MFRKLPILLLAAALPILGSCVKEREIPSPVRTHTLLAYIGGDNNLSPYTHDKVDALAAGFDGKPGQRLLIYLDVSGEDATLIEVTRGSDGNPSYQTLSSYHKDNSASATVLSRVIETIATDYPSDSYGLLVFSHASGWLPQGALNNPKGVAAPESRSLIVDGANEMELKDFANAIPDGMFDYIVFETCFMAGIEVAWELRGKAPYILASSAEIVHPGFSPVYPASTGKLLAGDVQAFGQSVFGHVLTYAENDVNRSATYSVIRTEGLSALAAFIRENCDFDREVDVTAVQRFDRNSYRLFFDFEDYFSRLVDTEQQRTELSRLIGACVPWKAATDGFMIQQKGYNGFKIEQHSGLTTYIPQPAFRGLNDAYAATGWAAAIEY